LRSRRYAVPPQPKVSAEGKALPSIAARILTVGGKPSFSLGTSISENRGAQGPREERQRGAVIAAQNWTLLTETVFSVILMPAEAHNFKIFMAGDVSALSRVLPHPSPACVCCVRG
jgi:hypothetical protein